MSNHVIQSKVFQNKFTSFWSEWVCQKDKYEDIRIWWDLTKIKIKQLTIWCAIELNNLEKQDTKNLELLLDKEDNPEERKKIQNKLGQLYQQKCDGARIRSRVRWYEEGECYTKYFHDLEKKRSKENMWTSILDKK